MTALPHPRPLTGPHPGQLDQTQPLRVLRHPDARLSFASFHPQAASNVPPYNPLDGSSNPKRIVVETHPGGSSNWRFVPRARLAEGVSDEGSWPRLCDVLGYVGFRVVDPSFELPDVHYFTESSLCVTRTNGIYINLILSTTVSFQHHRSIPLFAPRSRQRRRFPPLPLLPGHQFLPMVLKRKGGYQALLPVLRRKRGTRPRSGSMPFMLYIPVMTNPR